MPIDSSAQPRPAERAPRLDRQHRDSRRQDRPRNSSDWSSNRSQLGRLTTRAATPASASCRAAPTHTATSLPVPRRTTLGIVGVDDDARARSTAEPSVVTSMFWRLRISAGRAVVTDSVHPGVDRLVRVGRADHVQTGDRPQRGQLLDGLVSRAVLADADGVVGEHEADLRLGQRRQPDRRLHVVGEDEERAADGEDAAVLGHADHRCAHGVFADAEVDVAATRIGPSTAAWRGRARVPLLPLRSAEPDTRPGSWS